MEGERDYVHLFAKTTALIISKLFKGGASRLLGQDRLDIAECDYYQGVLWSPSYFAEVAGRRYSAASNSILSNSNP